MSKRGTMQGLIIVSLVRVEAHKVNLGKVYTQLITENHLLISIIHNRPASVTCVALWWMYKSNENFIESTMSLTKIINTIEPKTDSPVLIVVWSTKYLERIFYIH